MGRVNNGLEQCLKGVGIGLGKLLRDGKGAAGVTFPYVLGEHVDIARVLVNGALVEGVGREVSIHVTGFEVCHHFRWGNDTDLDILVGMDSTLGQVITQ